ncbi:MAG: sigma-70 family RNA polymerase sigma factor [Isosphaeraceae bacterium]
MRVSSDAPTSVTLLRRLRQSPPDEQAWVEFEKRYGPAIREWCRRWGVQAADADDVAQAMLLRLVDRLRGFEYDPQGSFRAWLRTMTQFVWAKLASDGFRTRRRNGDLAESRLATVEARDDLSQELEAQYDQELLETAMVAVARRVEPHTWEAFRLQAIEGLSGAEVAGRLDLRIATAYKARSKVQQMLRDEVARLDGSEPD